MPNSILAPDEGNASLTRGHGRRLTANERDRLTAEAQVLYGQGTDMRAVAEAIGVAYNTARKMLIGAGVELRSHGGARPGGGRKRNQSSATEGGGAR